MENPKLVNWIIHRLKNRFSAPEDELITQGKTEKDFMFILAKGGAEVVVFNQK